MARSPAHRFGQILGEVFEATIADLLTHFAQEHGLYLDQKSERTCRPRLKKCTWKDDKGNAHDLDFVLERGGSSDKLGIPVAFIEVAWRRYTKHSRNKAQEIQGAILPLIDTYRHLGPFAGAILGGIFTKGALDQLRSQGFSILYIPMSSIMSAFQDVGIEATSSEDTPDADFEKKIRAFESLNSRQHKLLTKNILRHHESEVADFIKSLASAVLRKVERIVILPLHGTPTEVAGIGQAIAFIQNYDDIVRQYPVSRYELIIRYNNGDHINASFGEKQTAIQYLRGFHPTPELPH